MALNAGNQVKVKSLLKCLKILECFTVKTPELGISEIAQKLDMHKSNVHNIVSTLVSAGYMEKNPATDQYRFSLKLLEFSYIITNRLDYQAIVLRVMQQISNKLGVMVYFGVMHHENVLYLYNTYPIALSSDFLVRSLMGEKAPLYCTALGKAMLSTLSPEDITRQIGTNFARFTPNTLVTVEDILKNVEEAGRRGYAVDNCEHENTIRCVGAPVRNRTGALIGGLCISGPVQQITDELIKEGAAALIAAAFDIRSRI
jgi:DNA-binding IclR family transcriptional regulator